MGLSCNTRCPRYRQARYKKNRTEKLGNPEDTGSVKLSSALLHASTSILKSSKIGAQPVSGKKIRKDNCTKYILHICHCGVTREIHELKSLSSKLKQCIIDLLKEETFQYSFQRFQKRMLTQKSGCGAGLAV